jgi:serine/threonine protein kinase
VLGLLDVLERAHKLGIINRDVQSDNIMVAKGESEENEMLNIMD